MSVAKPRRRKPSTVAEILRVFYVLDLLEQGMRDRLSDPPPRPAELLDIAERIAARTED